MMANMSVPEVAVSLAVRRRGVGSGLSACRAFLSRPKRYSIVEQVVKFTALRTHVGRAFAPGSAMCSTHLACEPGSGHHDPMPPSPGFRAPVPGPRGRLAFGLLAVLLGWLAASPSHAQSRGSQYGFVVANIQSAEGVPDDVAAAVRERLTAAIDAHERLVATLPADAPDPAAEPDKFAAYMKKRKITPYRVTVEITDYNKEVDDGPRGQRLSASVSLRMFGETMPVRVMAFSAAGGATVKLDVGKTVRPRDVEVANRDAIAQAVDDALAESVQRLDEKQKKGRGAKKKR
jgi:hypothetical protein